MHLSVLFQVRYSAISQAWVIGETRFWNWQNKPFQASLVYVKHGHNIT